MVKSMTDSTLFAAGGNNRAFHRIHGAGSEKIFQVIHIIENASADFGVARPLVLAAPDFQSVGADVEIVSCFLVVEFFLMRHVVSSFLGFAHAGCCRAAFEEKIRDLKNNKICHSDAGKKKNLRVLLKLGDFLDIVSIFILLWNLRTLL